MKNIINYYYNFNLINIYNINDSIYFNYKNNDYFFIKYDRSINEIQSIYNLNSELKKRMILTNSIILNKDNQIVTFVNNTPYILIRDDVKTKKLTINDILYIQNNTINIIGDKKLYRIDWIKMWQIKIDYYEDLMINIKKRYSLLYSNIDYYIGLGENAISYLVYNNVKDNNVCLSHKRINTNKNTFDYYNPINYILDNRTRDISEYIKDLFFSNNNLDLIMYYLNYINLSKEEYILLISRLLFPTYFFDVYDKIINNELDEKIVKPIIDKTDSYILFIKNIFFFIIYQKGINIPYIEWIIKDAN